MTSENQTNILRQLGWDADFERHFQSMTFTSSVPARVISDNRHLYQVFTEKGVLQAQLSGRLQFQAREDGGYPVVGDWVVLAPLPGEEGGIIHAVLPRKSRFSRQASGGRGRLSGGVTREQVVASNVDTVFIVGAMDEGRSADARKFERYLTLARASGTNPVIVLNKCDLCDDIDGYIIGIGPVLGGVPVYAVSAIQRTGLGALKSYITTGKTVALLGPSGVGKSALVNALLGEERQATGEIRERDHTGKHTTTSRELILIPGGGIVIDTPGMREIQLWAEGDDLLESFEDIEFLSRRCRFSDCKHGKEPGCAVRTAIESGELDTKRFASFEKLQKEVRYHEARQSDNASRVEKAKWKKISQFQKTRNRDD